MRENSPAHQRFTRRAIVAAGVGGLVWTGLLARLFQLQVMEGQRYSEMARHNRLRFDLDPPPRGEIYDRFGRPLASHRLAGRVSLLREQVEDLPATLRRIAELIDLPVETQERIIREARRQAAFVPTLVARELSYEEFARLSVARAGLEGVQVEMARTRSYPRGRDLAHVVGYVARANDRDLQRLVPQLDGDSSDEARERVSRMRQMFRHPDMRVGRSGVEFFAEEWLRGQYGFRARETNAAGRIIKEHESESVRPTPGRSVTLSIDSELQRAALEAFGEESGAAVVMDVATGQVLALASTPAFDPNDFVNGISTKDYAELRDNDRSPLYHKAYDGTYPPGSTFKMVVATAALEAGVTTPTERVFCNRSYRFGSRTWSCWKPGGHGSVDMHGALKGSCDVYFYEMARRTGVEKIAEVAHRYGFGEVWPLGMTGGRSGIVPDPEWKLRTQGEPWYEGETINFGIGQGQMQATPLQLAIMCARIAREDAFLVRPKLLVDGPPVDEHIPETEPFNPEHLQIMREGMFGVTSEPGGTGWRVGDLGLGGVRMAGKSGTAQVRHISAAERASGVIANSKLDRRLRDHALFVAYAPTDAPRYAVAVVVEHGSSGSSAAGPVANAIMREAMTRDSGAAPKVTKTASCCGEDHEAHAAGEEEPDREAAR